MQDELLVSNLCPPWLQPQERAVQSVTACAAERRWEGMRRKYEETVS